MKKLIMIVVAGALSSCANTPAVQTQWGQSTTSFFQAMETKHTAYAAGVQTQSRGGAR